MDHILENRDRLSDLYDHGIRVITSALEFPKNEVLEKSAKRLMWMTSRVGAPSAELGITEPDFIMFNPWIGLDDFSRFNDFFEETNMKDDVDPVQYETRLHLYKGSPLLKNETIRALKLQEQEFHYEWEHPDPRVDELFLASVTPAVEGEFKRCCLKC